MENLKTTVTAYCFDISDEGQAKKYEALAKRLKRKKYHKFAVLDLPLQGREDCRPKHGEALSLEVDHLFSNQWNTACGRRVFDWYEGVYDNESIKSGYYLEISPEMTAIRTDTLVCGYCGRLVPRASATEFCTACLSSKYLKAKDLHLLRLLPVGLHLPKRAQLAEDDREILVARYEQAQSEARKAALVGLRKSIIAKRDKKIEDVAAEASGMLWLLDHDLSIDNVIYYHHTETFCFGWRERLNSDEASRLLGVISEFPFTYEIKGVSRSWS